MTLYLLQLLRFFAAILVLLFHLEIMRSGYKGVDLFFVISGFVMYYTTLFLQRKPGRVFIVHRLTKIFVLYWIAMLVLYLVRPYPIDGPFLRTILLIPGHHSLLGISWSLSYELYFYFLFGMMLYLLPYKWSKILFLSLLMLSSIVTILNLGPYSLKGTLLNFLIGQNFWEFLLGILSAYIFSRDKKWLNSQASLILAILIAILFITIEIEYTAPLSFIVYGVMALGLVILVTQYEKHKEIGKLPARWLSVLGDSSYAIYLLSPIVTIVLEPKSSGMKIITIIVTVVSAIVVNRWVERPILKGIRRVFS